MRIVIAGDHASPSLKAELLQYITELGHECEDLGTYDDASCSYAEYGAKAAMAVAEGKYDRGILICGTGIGISITANKVRGIRCALCSEPTSARLTREHNDANMLAMGARTVGPEVAKDMVAVFLSTEFSGVERHKERIAQMMATEE